MPKKSASETNDNHQSNKNFTYHSYIETKKPRNHKCRESWPALLNKLGEHCINLGLSLESAFRDYEGTSVIFTSNGHDGPASDDFSKEGIIKITRRLQESLKLSLFNNKKKQEHENMSVHLKHRIQAENPGITNQKLKIKLKAYENDYEKKKHQRDDLLLIVYPKANSYQEKPDDAGQRTLTEDDYRFQKKREYLNKWEEGNNDSLPVNVRIYK